MKAIVLTRGRIATVDDKDFDRCNQFKWYAHKKRRAYYGARNIQLPDGSRTTEYLHNFILGVKGVDHRNGDGLENRRKNLRLATNQQNQWAFRRKKARASSYYRGVSWDKESQTWRSRILYDYKNFFLGRFAVEEDAARAYDKAARKLFGGFASLNFPRAATI